MPRLREFLEKLTFLNLSPHAQEIAGHSSTFASFCRAIGINRSSLRSAKNKDSVSPEISQLLATKLAFDPAWPEWKHGTCREFEVRYNKQHADPKTRALASKRTRNPLRVSRPRRHPPADELLASLQLGANQPHERDPFPITVELVCRPAPLGVAVVGVKRGKLRVNCGRARTTSIVERLGGNGPCIFEDRKLIVFASGDNKEPIWLIESEAAPIGVLVFPDGICHVQEVQSGDVISAEFQVHVKDLSTADAEAEDETHNQDYPHGQSYSFVRIDRQQLGAAAKNAILARLAQLELLGDDPWATLCRDELQFEDVANPE
jgi:hypothetical protein